ncbi:MAG: hypothetical protein Q8P18_08300 [Pseudomonadota bacterium]|nr:hypothetical protein [Pseudomonadota bacterium]
MMRLLPFLLASLIACAAPVDDGSCAEWPADATPADGVVDETCGWFTLPVGDHLYANVYIVEPESPCDVVLGPGLVLNSSPIYSAMSNDAPKWTVDVVAEAPGEALLVDVACEDGTRWQARVDVE